MDRYERLRNRQTYSSLMILSASKHQVFRPDFSKALKQVASQNHSKYPSVFQRLPDSKSRFKS